MPVADLTMNMIEFSDDASNSEGRQIPQSTASIRKVTEKVMDYRDGQEVFSDASKTSKVLGATLLNIRPLFIFLIMAETMLSLSMSTLKFSLARLMISERCRGSLAAVSMSYTIVTCDLLLFFRGGGSGYASSLRNSRMTFSCDLRSSSWNLAHSLTSMRSSFPKKLLAR